MNYQYRFYANGDQEYYRNNKKLSKKEFYAKPSCEGTVVEIEGVKYRLTAL